MTQSEVAEMLGISQQRLSYWLRSGLIQDVKGGGEIGRPCQFTPADVMQCLTILELKDQGASVQAIRRALDTLREKRKVDDWQYRWLAVTADGAVIWLNDSDQVERAADGQIFMLDVQDMKKSALESRAAEQEARTEEPLKVK